MTEVKGAAVEKAPAAWGPVVVDGWEVVWAETTVAVTAGRKEAAVGCVDSEHWVAADEMVEGVEEMRVAVPVAGLAVVREARMEAVGADAGLGAAEGTVLAAAGLVV